MLRNVGDRYPVRVDCWPPSVIKQLINHIGQLFEQYEAQALKAAFYQANFSKLANVFVQLTLFPRIFGMKRKEAPWSWLPLWMLRVSLVLAVALVKIDFVIFWQKDSILLKKFAWLYFTLNFNILYNYIFIFYTYFIITFYCSINRSYKDKKTMIYKKIT